jgi:GMP reductase
MFDYADINLVPKFCIVNSRSKCDTSVRGFKSPVIPANMECVINEEVAEKMARENYLYVMHRFGDTFEFVRNMNNKKLMVSISIGVTEDNFDLLNKIIQNDLHVHYITIDIAHGHCERMRLMISFIQNLFPDTYIIAGNVSTPEGFSDLETWGAHMIKVGIGPGYACTTYNATGFGSRGIQAYVIKECAKVRQTALIVADGGIQFPGDIAKSIVLGADFVMVGGMMSGFQDSPGKTIEKDGNFYKEFWGSASVYQNGKKQRVEGTKKLIPFKNESILDHMKYLIECLQSAISYGGGNTLYDLRKVKYYIKK